MVAGRYRIDGEVGKGGYGAVYCATQMDTGIPVALKILLKNVSTSAVDKKRFEREAALVQRLKHPRIVELLDFGTTEKNQPFIAFELLRGQSLSEHLKAKGPLPYDQAVRVSCDVLEGLALAHAHNFIHRDIKPGNVFLMEDGSGKLLDFGIAKAGEGALTMSTQLTEQGQMIGTPHYMAPEQVRGTGVHPATDVYGLALVMAEMITGTRVIQGKALIDVYMAHIEEAPLTFADAVKATALWPVIEQGASKGVEARHADAGVMLAHVRRAHGQVDDEDDMGATVMRPRPASLSDATGPHALDAPAPDSAFGGTMVMSGSSKALSEQLRNLPLASSTATVPISSPLMQAMRGLPASTAVHDDDDGEAMDGLSEPTVDMDHDELAEIVQSAVDAHRVSQLPNPGHVSSSAASSSPDPRSAASSSPAPSSGSPGTSAPESGPAGWPAASSSSAFSQLPRDEPVRPDAATSEPPERGGWLLVVVALLVLTAVGAGAAVVYGAM